MSATDASTRDLLRHTATRLFQDLCEPAALREAEGGIWAAALWRAVEDAGLPKALVPESAGGSGVAFADAMVIVHAAGWFALPLPLPETMLAGWLLARAGLPVPDGPAAASPACPGRGNQRRSSRWTMPGWSPSCRATAARSSPARMSRGSPE